MNDSIVVMERGAALPAWLDQQAGAESNVWVVAQGAQETTREFEVRALSCLHALEERCVPARALLVCAAESGPEYTALRGGVASELLSIMRRAGSGNVVLVADGGYAVRTELAALALQLSDLVDDAAAVSLRYRARSPSVAPPALSSRAA